MLMRQLACFCVLLGCSTVVLAQDMFIYPKNDQNAEQQQKDNSECYVWSKNQTGFDPANPPRVQTASVDTSPDGSVARGAVRGAALGAIVGNSDDAAKGAGVGMAVGAMRRRDRNRNAQKEQDAYEQQQADRLAELQYNYNRAFKGCMEARDYSVS
jgi:hypothetical protein